MKIKFKNLVDKQRIINGKEVILTKENINKIFNVILNKMFVNGIDHNGYTDIHYKVFQKEVYNYEKYINYLIGDGILDRNFYDKKSNKPYGYRFSSLTADELEIEEIFTEPSDAIILQDKIFHNTSKLVIVNEFNNFKRLEQDFNSTQVLLPPTNPVFKEHYNEGNSHYVNLNKWFSNNIRLKRWSDGLTHYKFKSNRLYTNFIQLSSKCRLSNIRLSGEKLIEFDIKNSFPLMLCIYCIKTNPDIVDDYEFQQFVKNVKKGNIYGKIQFGLNKERNSDKEGAYSKSSLNDDSDYGEVVKEDKSNRFIDRDTTKELFQIYLNSKTDRIAYIEDKGIQSNIKDWFKLNYTSIDNVVRSVKSKGDKMYDVLVALETKMMFNIINDVYKIDENIKILTCHDAIYVPESYKDKVEEVWNKHIKKINNMLPNITDEQVEKNEWISYG